MLAAQHHYFEWNNPGFKDIKGYEGYAASQSADVGRADTSFAARRATQPIGTPDEIIERIRSLQWAISLEEVVLHFFYGGMPPEKAEASLRLFAEKVLPAVQDMATPINPESRRPEPRERGAPGRTCAAPMSPPGGRRLSGQTTDRPRRTRSCVSPCTPS